MNTSRFTLYHFNDSKINYTCQAKVIIIFYAVETATQFDFDNLTFILKNAKLTENAYDSASGAWNVTVDFNGDSYVVSCFSRLFICWDLMYIQLQRNIKFSNNPGGVSFYCYYSKRHLIT